MNRTKIVGEPGPEFSVTDCPVPVQQLVAQTNRLRSFIATYKRFMLFNSHRGNIPWEPEPLTWDPFTNPGAEGPADAAGDADAVIEKVLRESLPTSTFKHHTGETTLRGVWRATLPTTDEDGNTVLVDIYHDARGPAERYILVDQDAKFSPVNDTHCTIISIDRGSGTPPRIWTSSARGPRITDQEELREIQLEALRAYYGALRSLSHRVLREVLDDLARDGKPKESYAIPNDHYIDYTMGSGKTFIVYSLIKASGGRGVIVVPNDAMAKQVAAEASAVLPDAEVALSRDLRRFLQGKESRIDPARWPAIDRVKRYIEENRQERGGVTLEEVRRHFVEASGRIPGWLVPTFLRPRDDRQDRVTIISAKDLLDFAGYLANNYLFIDELHLLADDRRYMVSENGNEPRHVITLLMGKNRLLGATGTPTEGVNRYFPSGPIATVNQHMLVFGQRMNRDMAWQTVSFPARPGEGSERTNEQSAIAASLVSQFSATHYRQPGQKGYRDPERSPEGDEAIRRHMDQNRVTYHSRKGIGFQLGEGPPLETIAAAFNAVFAGDESVLLKTAGMRLEELADNVALMRTRQAIAEHLWQTCGEYRGQAYGLEKELRRLRADDIHLEDGVVTIQGVALDLPRSRELLELHQVTLRPDRLRDELERGFKQQIADHLTDQVVAFVEQVRTGNIRDIREGGALDDYLARLSDGFQAYQHNRYTGDVRNVTIFKQMSQLAEQRDQFAPDLLDVGQDVVKISAFHKTIDVLVGVAYVIAKDYPLLLNAIERTLAPFKQRSEGTPSQYASLHRALDGIGEERRRAILDALIAGDFRALHIRAEDIEWDAFTRGRPPRFAFAVGDGVTGAEAGDYSKSGRAAWTISGDTLATGHNDPALYKSFHVQNDMTKEIADTVQAMFRTNRADDDTPAFVTNLLPACYRKGDPVGERPLLFGDVISPDCTRNLKIYGERIQDGEGRPKFPLPAPNGYPLESEGFLGRTPANDPSRHPRKDDRK